jgi:hypothetical protein
MNSKIVQNLPTSSLPTTAMTINFQEISQLTSNKLCQIADWVEHRTAQELEKIEHMNDENR